MCARSAMSGRCTRARARRGFICILRVLDIEREGGEGGVLLSLYILAGRWRLLDWHVHFMDESWSSLEYFLCMLQDIDVAVHF